MATNPHPKQTTTAENLRRKLTKLFEDLRETRDQGKRALSDISQVALFKGMHYTLSSTYEQFETHYDDLCDIILDNGNAAATATDHSMRTAARRYFNEANGYWATLTETTSQQIGSNQANVSFGCNNKAKLPRIQLLDFYGDRIKWLRWKANFVSLVKDDPSLTEIDKFHYLVGSLKGKAASIIAHVPIDEAHFSIAWDALMETYDNQRLLASSYLEILIDMRPLTQKPSADTLNTLVAKLSETVAAFKIMDIPDKMEFVFFHLASRCLDPRTREEFEQSNTEEFPTFDRLIRYLRSRCTAAELAAGLSRTITVKDLSKPGSSAASPGRNYRTPTSSRTALVTSPNPTINNSTGNRPGYIPLPCLMCKRNHKLENCFKFASASVAERHQLLRNWNGCRNCLVGNHVYTNCHSKYRCRFCKGRHHSLLHIEKQSGGTHTDLANDQQHQPKGNGASSSKSALHASSRSRLEVMLGTIICLIEGKGGKRFPIRVVLDSGSQFSFISKSFAERLQLPVVKHPTGIWGIGETPLAGSKDCISCTLSPVHSSYPRFETNAIVLDVITAPLPGFDISSEYWEPYTTYPLADPGFWITSPVDFLIGCDLFTDIITGDIITLSSSMPRLLGTVFGYSVLGRVREITQASSAYALHTSSIEPHLESLHQELHRFWDLEEPPTPDIMSPEDQQCEELFRTTHYRMADGRYVVRLPFKTLNPPIASTRGMALRRLQHLESKLERNSKVKAKYHEFLQEYLDLGHMELAKEPGKVLIPHHCVVKALDNDEIKLRVVFDAAARSASGSLNDHLLVGPKLQANLVVILLNFRLHPYVFTADAVKMYRQILIHPEDRAYQHILWRFSVSKAVQEYELNTVSYGTSPAPYLSLRVLRQLVLDEGQPFPLAADALLQDTYMDDVATGAPTLGQALDLLHQLIALMSKGGFSLSKWASNHPEIVSACQQADPTGTLSPNERVSMDASAEEGSIKILGMQWDPREDIFSYNITLPRTVCTKRAVLSAVAKIYDPLGYLGPTIILAKQLIQVAWILKLDWDTEFPIDMRQKWLNFLELLPSLTAIKIPRWVVPRNGPYWLLIFADASERAYCAAAYLRSISPEGPQVHLIMAKTKLAPVKFTTIPRLELCAALLAAKVWQSLQPFCERLTSKPEVYFFSDSTVVLSWLTTPYHVLKTFVANRVVQIRDLTGGHSWRHVPTADNPSDLGSRGIPANELPGCPLWFHGPDWAIHEPTLWPPPFVNTPQNLPEVKCSESGQVLIVAKPEGSHIIKWMHRFSSYRRLIRSLAYVLRFIDGVKQKRRRPSFYLGLEEVRRAVQLAVRMVQQEAFYDNCMPTTKTPVPKNLISLSPFLDEAGVLLVGGRLKHSDLSWASKHPMLLPSKTHLSSLILAHYHQALRHPGSTLLLSAVRSKFWIIGARNAARALSKCCVQCRRYDARPCQPVMGDLPADRCREGNAFVHVGVDYAGPFITRESLRRKAATSKSYLCLFVCLSTKALHLELVSALSTPAFIAALTRFIGRRGLPAKIYSDNGTNFVGAARKLKEFYAWFHQESVQREICDYALARELEWTFIPPHAPSFGGVWEAGVKSVKRLLRTTYGEGVFTFEELNTLLIEIESFLNSRPLCAMSNDPNDMSFLTAGHFLTGSSLIDVPRPSLLDTNENRLTRWELVEKKAQFFWQRWRREYLTNLQERSKWRLPSPNLQIGDLVLLGDDGVPRKRWPVGRVVQVYPGDDGVVRVADVKIPSSSWPAKKIEGRSKTEVLRRPAIKLVPLFLPEEFSPKLTSTTRSSLQADE